MEGQVEFFKELKEKGYQITKPHDDYMMITPPYREGFYWARCKGCYEIFEEEEGCNQRLCKKCSEGE